MGFKVAVTKIELYALNFTSQMDVSCNARCSKLFFPLAVSFKSDSKFVQNHHSRQPDEWASENSADGCENINYVPWESPDGINTHLRHFARRFHLCTPHKGNHPSDVN